MVPKIKPFKPKKITKGIIEIGEMIEDIKSNLPIISNLP